MLLKEDLDYNWLVIISMLGDFMSLLDEYGKNKERKGEDNIILSLLRAGHSPHVIARDTHISLARVDAIRLKHGL